MSCDVCLYAADDVDDRFFRADLRTARKEHTCCECREVIRPGHRYEHAFGIDGEGGAFTSKTCEICAEVRTVFYCGHAYYVETLWDEMEEQAFPNLTTASECFRELSPAAKAVVLERWTRWKGLTA